MNVYEIVQQNILKRLEEAIKNNESFQWVKPWKSGIMPTNYVSKKPYRGINLLLLEEGGYYLTYKQVVQLKGKVKKGAKKLPVVYWNFSKGNSSDNINEDGEEVDDKKNKVVFKYYSVFHQSDIEGIDFPENKSYKHELDENSIAYKLVEGYKEIVPIYECPNSDRAFYRPLADTISVPSLSQFESKYEYYSTLFHEMIHSTGHESRLNRESLISRTEDNYSKEELVAEIGSSLLRAYSDINDVETDKNSVAYLKGC